MQIVLVGHSFAILIVVERPLWRQCRLLKPLEELHVAVWINSFSSQQLQLCLIVSRLIGSDINLEMRKFVNTFFR